MLPRSKGIPTPPTRSYKAPVPSICGGPGLSLLRPQSPVDAARGAFESFFPMHVDITLRDRKPDPLFVEVILHGSVRSQ